MATSPRTLAINLQLHMKTLHTLAIGALCALALISCDRKFEKTVLAPEASFTAATLTGVSEVIVDANNNKVLFLLTCPTFYQFVVLCVIWIQVL